MAPYIAAKYSVPQHVKVYHLAKEFVSYYSHTLDLAFDEHFWLNKRVFYGREPSRVRDIKGLKFQAASSTTKFRIGKYCYDILTTAHR